MSLTALEVLCSTPFPSQEGSPEGSSSQHPYRPDDTLPSPPQLLQDGPRHTTQRPLEYSSESVLRRRAARSCRSRSPSSLSGRGADSHPTDDSEEAAQPAVVRGRSLSCSTAAVEEFSVSGNTRSSLRVTLQQGESSTSSAAIRCCSPVPANRTADTNASRGGDAECTRRGRSFPSSTNNSVTRRQGSSRPDHDLPDRLTLLLQVKSLEEQLARVSTEKDESDRQRRNISILLDRSTAYMEDLKCEAAAERRRREAVEQQYRSAMEETTKMNDEFLAIQQELQRRLSQGSAGVGAKDGNLQGPREEHSGLHGVTNSAEVASNSEDTATLLREELREAYSSMKHLAHTNDKLRAQLKATAAAKRTLSDERHSLESQRGARTHRQHSLSTDPAGSHRPQALPLGEASQVTEELRALVVCALRPLLEADDGSEVLLSSEVIYNAMDVKEAPTGRIVLSNTTLMAMTRVNQLLREVQARHRAQLNLQRKTAESSAQHILSVVTELLKTHEAEYLTKVAAICERVDHATMMVKERARSQMLLASSREQYVAQLHAQALSSLEEELKSVQRHLKNSQAEKAALEHQLLELQQQRQLTDAFTVASSALQDSRLSLCRAMRDVVEDVQQMASVDTNTTIDVTFLKMVQTAALKAEAHVQMMVERHRAVTTELLATPPRNRGPSCSVRPRPTSPRHMTHSQQEIYAAMQRVIHGPEWQRGGMEPSCHTPLTTPSALKHAMDASLDALVDGAMTVSDTLRNLCTLLENNRRQGSHRTALIQSTLRGWERCLSARIEAAAAVIQDSFRSIQDTSVVVRPLASVAATAVPLSQQGNCTCPAAASPSVGPPEVQPPCVGTQWPSAPARAPLTTTTYAPNGNTVPHADPPLCANPQGASTCSLASVVPPLSQTPPIGGLLLSSSLSLSVETCDTARRAGYSQCWRAATSSGESYAVGASPAVELLTLGSS